MLIDATTSLRDGLRLRVRLPHPADRPGIHALHARLGLAADELDVARILRFDPQSRTVACATAWVGGAEQPVAYGAIDAGAVAPDLLIADEASAPGVRALLDAVLRDRAQRRLAA